MTIQLYVILFICLLVLIEKEKSEDLKHHIKSFELQFSK